MANALREIQGMQKIIKHVSQTVQKEVTVQKEKIEYENLKYGEYKIKSMWADINAFMKNRKRSNRSCCLKDIWYVLYHLSAKVHLSLVTVGRSVSQQHGLLGYCGCSTS